MIEVLDASGMIALLRAEAGGNVVASLLMDPAHTCYAHVLNVAEVFYDFHRQGGEPAGQAALNFLSAGVVFYDEMPADLWLDASRLKAVHRRVSLADCFCLALARRLGGEVVTADHHEFDPLVPLGLCPIRFIR
jgi:PIN domain nuclease of toxin-antitoxin system